MEARTCFAGPWHPRRPGGGALKGVFSQRVGAAAQGPTLPLGPGVNGTFTFYLVGRPIPFTCAAKRALRISSKNLGKMGY